MIVDRDVRTYRRDGVFWVEAISEVEASGLEAWQAIERLIAKLVEDGTSTGTEFVIDERTSDEVVVAEGTRIAALTRIMGLFRAAAVITFDEVEPDRRAHGRVAVLGATQGEVEFVIEPQGRTCRMTYRHGVHSQQGQPTVLSDIEDSFAKNTRQVPNVVEIFNTWEKLALDLTA